MGGAGEPVSVASWLKLSGPSVAVRVCWVTAASVANKSILQMSASDVVACGIFPGQRAMKGTRWPPSHAPNL